MRSDIRVLIVDDHAVTRAGYGSFLREMGIQSIGEAGGGREALAKLAVQPWDIVLLDIHMGGMTGIEALQSIVTLYARTRVLVTSALPQEIYALNVMKLGASGFLPKTGDFESFRKAVSDVVEGRKYVSDSVAELIASNMDSGAKLLHQQLSYREAQVFRGLVSGEPRASIASRLQIDPKTIGTYRSRMLRKMQMKSTRDLIDYAQRHGLRFDMSLPDVPAQDAAQAAAHPSGHQSGGIPNPAPASRRPAGRPRADLGGRAVLIVEDDFCQARDLQQALQHAGATVLGPYAEASDALRCISSKPSNCAVVDLHLRDGINFDVARALRDKGIPLLFLTGYSQHLVGRDFQTESIIEKPADMSAIISAVARLSLARTADC